jgi:DNA segregation ATPase FtsK/SpoIIIE-like protein
LAFLVGYGENKRPEWRSLEDMPHFLIGGQTSGGKSNFQHSMICTMTARNKPTDVNFLMIDLKFGGIEFGRYEGLPHLVAMRPGADPDTYVKDVPKGIAENSAEGLKMLEWFVDECEKRGREFKQEKIQNIKIWNRKHRNRHMPELVVIIDELALLLDDPSTKKQIFELIRRSASTARAAGGHIIAATQSANKSIINETIKVNFPGRLCFSTPDASSSILFVGDGSAINLMPAGRGYFKYGTTQFMVQTPLIEPYNIQEIVNNSKKGEITRSLKNHVLTPEEVIDWAIEDNASALGWRDVLAKFGSGRGIEVAAVKKLLQDMEGNIYTVGDRMYQVLPGGGNKPRIVVRIEANVPSTAPNSASNPQPTEESDNKFPCPFCSAMRSETPCEWCRRE